MTTNFYIQVATCVATGDNTEAYVLAGTQFNGIGPADLSQALLALEGGQIPSHRLAHDYNSLPMNHVARPQFYDNATGFVDVKGVVVEFAVAKVAADKYRVLFHRIDAGELYSTTRERLAKLETAVAALAASA